MKFITSPADLWSTYKYHCENCRVLYLHEGYDEFFCSEKCMEEHLKETNQ